MTWMGGKPPAPPAPAFFLQPARVRQEAAAIRIVQDVVLMLGPKMSLREIPPSPRPVSRIDKMDARSGELRQWRSAVAPFRRCLNHEGTRRNTDIRDKSLDASPGMSSHQGQFAEFA